MTLQTTGLENESINKRRYRGLGGVKCRRLMAEIIRFKHIRARWSTKGLENIMRMLMVRHVEPDK
ncbi:MAG: hypothetical protein JRN37_02110 [Nitrososphaerota archaeon]|nr:hypothetical protein [Nitrososphaerota archaeon]MDG7037947.1 hypothetical protein [Nitrososphaerota archaeon]